MATKIHAKNEVFGIIRQNKVSGSGASAFIAADSTTDNQWTNPGLVATDYRTLYLTPGSVIADPNVQVDEYNLTSQLGLHKETTNSFVNKVSGLKRVPFAGIADRNTIAPFLVGALQAVSDVSSTPYQKTITSGFVAGCIDFAAGSGYLHTIAGKQNEATDDGWLLENAIIDTLTLNWNFTQPGKGKLVGMSGTWVGNEFNSDLTLSGGSGWTATTLAPFNNSDAWSFTTFTVDSVDWKALCVKSISLTINNNVTSNCATSAGKPNQYDVAPTYIWTINMDYNSTTAKVVGDYQAGANVDITFLNNAGSGVSGFFSIDMPYGQIISNPSGYDNNYKSYSIQVEAKQATTVSPITILVADALQWAYNEP